MSYTDGLAAYHTKRIKRYIDELPELFGGLKRLSDSESILYYQNGDHKFYCEPGGVLTAKRGKHPHFLLCDDILRDPDNIMELGQLEKIERTYFEQLESMPTEELHLIGTPQYEEDLFAQLEKNAEYNCRRHDSILNEAKRLTWWTGKYPYDKLVGIKNRIGEKTFNKEYRARPVRGEEGYISAARLDQMIMVGFPGLAKSKEHKLREWTFAGFDIGKKTHPSHLCILGINRKGKLIQLLSKWMDGWDYKDQLSYLEMAIKNFKIAKLLYDNTRAEFEGFAEEGRLPAEMEGVAFSSKNKFTMATDLDEIITRDELRLVDDPRQRRQLLLVDNDLNAMTTKEGHGDCFFSLCLANRARKEGMGILAWDLTSQQGEE